MNTAYRNLGVEFIYPKNWQVTEESASGWPRGVSFQIPDGGFWTLQLHPQANPRELVAQALKTMRQEYEDLEAEPVTELIGEVEVVGFDMTFYCLDLVVDAATRALRLGKITALLFYQAEDRDFERLAPAFAELLGSLVQSLTPEDSASLDDSTDL